MLVIACPHALGLAIPLVIAISTTLGARSGLLVRDRRGLEEARNLDAVVFDKTGTLTLGEFRVVDIATDDGLAPDDALRLAAAVERDSEHPIARGIVRARARARPRAVPRGRAVRGDSGPGRASARRRTRALHGRADAAAGARRSTLPPTLREAAERAAARGQASIYLADDDRVLAAFAVADAVRPESREAIQRAARPAASRS